MLKNNLLITGGSGFIGTHLCRTLLDAGHSITILDLVPTALSHPNLKYIQGDIRNPDDLKKTINTDTDAVYHFAAIVSVPECEHKPEKSFETNLRGTQNILNRLVELKPHKTIPLFFASSAAVYGDLCKPGHKLNETENLPKPLSFYGLHKYASEQSIRLYCETQGLRGLSFRFFNVYGPGQKADSPYSGVITIFQRAFETGSEVKLFNNGENSRDFIHVTEIARACSLALNVSPEKLDGSPINLCTGESVLIKDVFQKMSDALGKKIPFQNLPAREGDIQFSCGDASKAKTLLGFSTQNTIDF